MEKQVKHKDVTSLLLYPGDREALVTLSKKTGLSFGEVLRIGLRLVVITGIAEASKSQQTTPAEKTAA